MSKTNNGLPDVLAMQRLMMVTDGDFIAKTKNGKEPVYVERIKVRASNMPGEKKKEGKDSGSSMPQTIETAKLPTDAVGLIVRFGIKFIDMNNAVTSCVSPKKKDVDANAFRSMIDEFIEHAKESDSINQVALRYAHRILSGAWLWRNRVLTDDISIKVSRDGESVSFDDAMSLNPNVFDDYSDAHHKLAEWLVDGMNGNSYSFVKVEAELNIGMGGVEVFPSQTFPSEKTDVSKVLYKKFIGRVGDSETILGQAAFRDQKISNAIRTIDTWYEGCEGRPIAVEPYGACLSTGEFYRLKNSSGAALLEHLDTLDVESDDGKYMIALIMRGGVFTSKA